MEPNTGGSDVRPRKYEQVIRYVRETPWAILPQTLNTILEIVDMRARGVMLTDEEIAERIGPRRNAFDERLRQISAMKDRMVEATRGRGEQPQSVAVIPLYGVLMPRAGLFAKMSGAVSLEEWGEIFQGLVDDPGVGSILIDVDSPGGSVELVQETAAKIRQARDKKRVVAIANTIAASGAYHLVSQASELVVTPSGMVGSIGVFTTHDDVSEMAASAGFKRTYISAGKYKVEGNPFEPLSDEAREALQAVVDEFYVSFVGDVAKGRGVSYETARDDFGEGRMVTAPIAVRRGMADRVETFEQTLGRMLSGDMTPRSSGNAGTTKVTITGDVGHIKRTLARYDAILNPKNPEGGQPSRPTHIPGAERLLSRRAVRRAFPRA